MTHTVTLRVAPSDRTTNLGIQAQPLLKRPAAACPNCGAGMILVTSKERPPNWSCNRLSSCGTVIWFETAQDEYTGQHFFRRLYPSQNQGWNRGDLWSGPFSSRDEAAKAAAS